MRFYKTRWWILSTAAALGLWGLFAALSPDSIRTFVWLLIYGGLTVFVLTELERKPQV